MNARRWGVLLVAILALAILIPVLFMTGWAWGRGGGLGVYPMMPGMPHMWGFYAAGNWAWMAVRIVLPIVLIALAVWGLAGLMAGSRRPADAGPAASRACANCRRAAQSDWTTCPYCGKPLG